MIVEVSAHAIAILVIFQYLNCIVSMSANGCGCDQAVVASGLLMDFLSYEPGRDSG